MMNWSRRKREWQTVIALYHQQRGRLPLWHLVKAAWSGPVPRNVWRARILRGCNGCPVFNRALHEYPDGTKRPLNACAGPHGSGCGCYIPLLALSANPNGSGCWMHTVNDGQAGWPAYRFPTILHRLWAPIRFLLGR